MASGPATKASYAGYTQTTRSTTKATLTATRAQYVALYYKDTPVGKGTKGKKTRASNRKTAMHHHLSNRLAAAAHTDAWHHKFQASGQR